MTDLRHTRTESHYDVRRNGRHIGNVKMIWRGASRRRHLVIASSLCDCTNVFFRAIKGGTEHDGAQTIAAHWEKHHPVPGQSSMVEAPAGDADNDIADSWGGPVGVGFKGDIAQAIDP